jgi:hypothetical protein
VLQFPPSNCGIASRETAQNRALSFLVVWCTLDVIFIGANGPLMSNDTKQLSNPFSTGGGGHNFENNVQTAFVVLMLTGGVVPCLQPFPIKQIKLQGKYAGYNTDDFIVFVESRNGEEKAKLLAQIKHSVGITENDETFCEVIQAAWNDFQNPEIFDRTTDKIALITGPLTAHDIDHARIILDWARQSATAEEFLDKVNLANFSAEPKRTKLAAFRAQLRRANGNVEVATEQFWQFLKCFYLLGYDLDVTSGVTLSLLNSHIGQFKCGDVAGTWARVAKEIEFFNQNAGTITIETISKEIKVTFSEHAPVSQIPAEFLEKLEAREKADFSKGEIPNALALASLLGSWNDKSKGDLEIIKKLIEV